MPLTFFKEILRSSLWSDDTINFSIKKVLSGNETSQRNESLTMNEVESGKNKEDRSWRSEREKTLIINDKSQLQPIWKFSSTSTLSLLYDGTQTCQLITNRISRYRNRCCVESSSLLLIQLLFYFIQTITFNHQSRRFSLQLYDINSNNSKHKRKNFNHNITSIIRVI